VSLQGPAGVPGESTNWEFLEIVGGLQKGSISLHRSSVKRAPLWGSRRTGGGGLRGRTSLPSVMRGPFTGNSES
jgi:hypothetical protein